MATPKEEAATLGWRPHLIRSAIVSLVQSLFSDAVVIRDPILDNYVWDSDVTTTKIKIDTDGLITLQNLGLQAHIAVILGDTAFENFLMSSDLWRRRASDGYQWRVFLAKTPLVIRCFGQTGEFALILAGETGVRLREAAKGIEDWNDWKHFMPSGIGVPKLILENEYSVDVPVTVHVQYGSKIHKDNLPTSLADDYDVY